MLRLILSTVLVAIVAAVLFVAVWPQALGLQMMMGVSQVVSFRIALGCVLLIFALILAFVALVRRRARRFCIWLIVVVLLAGGAEAGLQVDRGFGGTNFAAKAPADLTVVSWNTLGGAPGSQTIASLALDSGADIVSLPETDSKTANAVAALMTASGHPMIPYTVAPVSGDQVHSTSVIVSAALGAYSVDTTAGSTKSLPTVVLRPADANRPVIIAVHAIAPTSSAMAAWAEDLTWLNTICSSSDVIMAGDFNATVDHLAGFASESHTLLGQCRDAGQDSGTAAVGTWPTSVPAVLGAPIDHVMYTNRWKASGMRVVQNLDGAGSDHRPIVVQLSPTS